MMKLPKPIIKIIISHSDNLKNIRLTSKLFLKLSESFYFEQKKNTNIKTYFIRFSWRLALGFLLRVFRTI